MAKKGPESIYTKGTLTGSKNSKTKKYFCSSDDDPKRRYKNLKMNWYIQQKKNV
jgi:hypothetical protein